MNIRTALDRAEEYLFRAPAASGAHRWLNTAFIALLFLVGALHWAFLLGFGDAQLNACDWPSQNEVYSVLKQSLTQGVAPYRISYAIHGTDRFLGLPYVVLSPQVLLLPLLSVAQFIVADTVLLYAVGFVGLLLIRRRYALSPVAFATLFLLFNFNGHIVSHIGVGHLWQGYFLLPYFCLGVLAMVEGRVDATVPIGLAIVVVAVLMQGSVHQAVWCMIFLALLGVFNRACRRPCALAIGLTALLGAFRWVPSALVFRDKGYTFIGGYRSLWDLFESLVTIREPGYALHIGREMRRMDWWEYDLFIGVVALAVVLFLGLIVRWRKGWDLGAYAYRALDLPMLLFALFSLNYFYSFFARLPIPLMNVERVSSRFIIIPFLFLLIIACIRMQGGLDRLGRLGAVKWLVIPALMETAFSLMNHSLRWSVALLERALPGTAAPSPLQLVAETDPIYKGTVLLSLVLSFLTLLAMVGVLIRNVRRRMGPAGR